MAPPIKVILRTVIPPETHYKTGIRAWELLHFPWTRLRNTDVYDDTLWGKMENSGPEVIKLCFMLNSTEYEIFHVHEC